MLKNTYTRDGNKVEVEAIVIVRLSLKISYYLSLNGIVSYMEFDFYF